MAIFSEVAENECISERYLFLVKSGNDNDCQRHRCQTVYVSSNQIKSNIFATQKAECNIKIERLCRQDTKAVRNYTNRCPINTKKLKVS